MDKIGFIPLRAGSKGIINKNKKKILGRPLFTWTLAEAIFSDLDQVYVFTDDEWIISYVNQEYAWSPKVKTFLRSKESATDTASTEFAMEELAKHLNFNFGQLYLLQATSPLTTSIDINNAIKLLNESDYDSVLSVVKTHRFIWDKSGRSLNYEYLNRPRRQDFEGLLIENGAIYGIKTETYRKNLNRLGGKIGVFEMPEDTLTEIDEPSDLLIVEQLLANRLISSKRPTSRFRFFVMDVDGVLTNATVAYTQTGEFSKDFSLVDGMGISFLPDHGITPIVITSENSPIVEQRMKKIGIEYVFMGVKDKYSFLRNFLSTKNSSMQEIAYVGDDINDLANIYAANLSFAPLNGMQNVQQAADFTLSKEGSKGAIREAIEITIKFNGRNS